MEITRMALSEDVTLYLTAVEHRADRHAAAHRLCEEVTGGPLRFEPSGRPWVPGGPAVSLSHSGSLAACAVGTEPIGADLERARSVSPRLLDRAKAAGWDRAGNFLLWWTAREANGKRLGRGFTWSPLPPSDRLVQGTLAHNGQTYYYSVCW